MTDENIQLLSAYRHMDMHIFKFQATDSEVLAIELKSIKPAICYFNQSLLSSIPNNHTNSHITLLFSYHSSNNYPLLFQFKNNEELTYCVKNTSIVHLENRQQKSNLFKLLLRAKNYYPKDIYYSTLKLIKNSFEQLKPKLKIISNEETILIIDHSIGGGANQYSADKYFKDKDKNTHLLSFNTLLSKYTLSFQMGREQKKHYYAETRDIIELLISTQYNQIVVNNLVSFPNTEIIVFFLQYLVIKYKTLIQFNIHDYHSICPKWNLIDNRGQYCHLPNEDTCNKCLSIINPNYTHFRFETNIRIWRDLHESLLQESTDINVFSTSSLKKLNKVFPSIKKDVFNLKPHKINYITSIDQATVNTSEIVLGIIGTITEFKGLNIIESLADRIKESKSCNIKLVVIGAPVKNSRKGIIHYTGKFTKENLTDIVKKENINIFLYPSICPETFSYVAEEMYHMELPIILFNIGAPAERLATFKKTKIIELSEQEQLITIIKEHFSNCYEL